MSISKLLAHNTSKLLQGAAKKIRAERIGLELTQKEFADFVEIKYATYKNFEQSGKISFEGFLQILIKLNKQNQFENFLNGFEFNEAKQRVSKAEDKSHQSDYLKPIIKANQKQIVLDKNVFGTELFYSVQDGHTYEVPNFIGIVLNSWSDERLMLLIKYFGQERLKPHILKQKDVRLLKAFNSQMKFLERRYYEKQ